MKLKYEKPMVAVERYELSQSIASCAIKMAVGGTQYCLLFEDPVPKPIRDAAGLGYFADSDCDIQPNKGDTFDGICYHTSAGGAFIS